MAQNIEDEFKIGKAKKSKSGSINLKKMRGRFSKPSYVKAVSSGRPESVVKIAGYRQGYTVKQALDYISRIDNENKENVDCEDQNSGLLKGEKDILETYDAWKKDFSPQKEGLKRQKRDAVHIILSGACKSNPANNRKVLAAARKTISDELGSKGYEYVCALHQDSKSPHVHFVVKCESNFKEQGKLRINKPELFALRTQFAANLRDLGLDHVATMRRDRPELVERLTKGLDRLKKNETQYQRAMKRAAPSKDALLYRQNVSKTITRLQEQIKKETKPATKERRDLLAKVRTVKRLLTKNRPGMEQEIKATLTKYDKDFEKLKKLVAAGRPQEKDEKANLDKFVENQKKALVQNIARAKDEIKKSDAPDSIKKESLATLKNYEKNMKTAFTKDPVKREFNKIEQGLKQIKDMAKNVLNLSEKAPKTAIEKLRHGKELDRKYKELEKEIKDSRLKIKSGKIKPNNKEILLKQLRELEKMISKQQSRTIGRGIVRNDR